MIMIRWMCGFMLKERKKMQSSVGGSTLGQGASAPQIHLLPQIQKLTDHSDMISEVPKCSKINFSGAAPRNPLQEELPRPSS